MDALSAVTLHQYDACYYLILYRILYRILYLILYLILKRYLCTRAPAPPIIASTSFFLAVDVSPGVVMASAPCAAP